MTPRVVKDVAAPDFVGAASQDQALMSTSARQDASAAIFGNRHFASVLAAAEQIANARAYFTVRDIARLINLQDGLVRGVVLRAVAAGLLTVGGRAGGARSALYYELGDGATTQAVLAAARAVAEQP